jgi:hypothetical protein
MIRSVLTGLRDVPWEQLTHAYGPATDVPALLEQLAEPDDAAREAALGHLYGNVFHQGTRYQASRFVVPFLIDIACRPGPRRADIVSMISHLAVGYPDEWLSQGFDLDAVRAEQEQYDEDAAEWQSDAVEVYQAVCAQEIQLIELLRDDYEDVQVQTAYALALLPEIAPATVGPLSELVEGQNEARPVASAALALSLLHQRAPFAVGKVIERLRGHESWIVQFAAASLEARPGNPGPLPGWSEGRLLSALSREPDASRTLPWNEGDIPGLAAKTLGRRPLADDTLAAVCAALDTAVGLRAVRLAAVVLAQAFSDEPPSVPEYARDLDPRQRRVVRALQTAAGWRLAGGTFGNFYGVVTASGLPGDQAEIARWLGGADLDSCRPIGLRRRAQGSV